MSISPSESNANQSSVPKNKPLMHIGEAALCLGIGRGTMSKWIAKGKIQKIPDTQYITTLEIVRFLEDNSRSSKPMHGPGSRGPYNVGKRR
jgi:hypothetical protein